MAWRRYVLYRVPSRFYSYYDHLIVHSASYHVREEFVINCDIYIPNITGLFRLTVSGLYHTDDDVCIKYWKTFLKPI